MRILFITSNSLGDVVLSTALLSWIISQHPGAEVTVVCGKMPASLFRAVPGIAEIISVDKKKFSSHWVDVYRRLIAKPLSGKRWDVMVDLRNVGLLKLLPAGIRIPGPKGSNSRHKLHQLAELIDANDPPEPTVWLDAEATDFAQKMIPDGGPVIGVGPATAAKTKLWRPEHFVAVIEALTAPNGVLPGARVALFGAPDECTSASKVRELLPREKIIDLVGATDPLQAAAALGRCVLYFGADSGLMHLAAAMGVPTLGLFGEHGVPQTYRPWGKHTAYIFKRNPLWTKEDKPSAMDGIRPDEVIRAAEELIRRAGL